jgi:hypothetical protein
MKLHLQQDSMEMSMQLLRSFPQIKTNDYQRDPLGRVIVDAASGVPLAQTLQNQGKTTPDIVGLF